MSRMKKITIFTGIGLLSVVVIAIVAVYAFVIQRPVTSTPVITEAKPYEWNKVKLGGNTLSSDGSEYFIWTKTGESNNWIIFFPAAGSAGMPGALHILLSS